MELICLLSGQHRMHLNRALILLRLVVVKFKLAGKIVSAVTCIVLKPVTAALAWLCLTRHVVATVISITALFLQLCVTARSTWQTGVPRRQSHRRSGLATLPFVGAIP